MKRVIAISLVFVLLLTVPVYASDSNGFNCTYCGSDKVLYSSYEMIGHMAITGAQIVSLLGQPTLRVSSQNRGDGIRYDTYTWESKNIVPWIRITFKNGSYYSKSSFLLFPTAAEN